MIGLVPLRPVLHTRWSLGLLVPSKRYAAAPLKVATKAQVLPL